MAGRRRADKTGSRTGGEQRLPALGREFGRHRARGRRERRQLNAIEQEPHSPDAAEVAKSWSATMDEALKVAEIISREPVHDLDGLVIKFEAAWWWIIEDDSLLDDRARLWLLRFRRSLHRLARET